MCGNREGFDTVKNVSSCEFRFSSQDTSVFDKPSDPDKVFFLQVRQFLLEWWLFITPDDSNLEFAEVFWSQNLLFAIRSSLFRAALRPPTKSIRFAFFHTRAVDDYKIQVTQLLRPSNLSSRPGLGGEKVLKFLVIGINRDWFLHSLKVMFPFQKGNENSEKFLVVNIIVSFSRI